MSSSTQTYQQELKNITIHKLHYRHSYPQIHNNNNKKKVNQLTLDIKNYKRITSIEGKLNHEKRKRTGEKNVKK